MILLSLRNARTGRDAKTSSITMEALGILADIPNLQYLSLIGYDFSASPDAQQLTRLQTQLKKVKLSKLSFDHTKIHPKILKSVCEIETLRSLSVFYSAGPSEDNSISYEKLMYHLRKVSSSMFDSNMGSVPDYYEKLERPYFDEFYVRQWTSSDAGPLSKAAFVDLKEGKVLLKTTYDGATFSIPFNRLSKEDQKYVQEIVAP